MWQCMNEDVLFKKKGLIALLKNLLNEESKNIDEVLMKIKCF